MMTTGNKKHNPAPLLVRYAETVTSAMMLHQPCSDLGPVVRKAFALLASHGVATAPNDFQFHYTGGAEFRWHDGDSKHFGSSNRWCGMVVCSDGISINGTVPKTDRDRHFDKGRITIDGLEIDDAMTVLAMLIRIVAKHEKEEDNA